MNAADILPAALAAAVPRWIDDLCGQPADHLDARRKVCAEAIAAHGDIILYPSARKGATAEAFNRLAEGLAIGAIQAGRIDAFGISFTADCEADR